MKYGDPLRISPMIERLMPDASPEEQREAQVNLDNFIAVAYRICDRMVREAEDAKRDKAPGDATVDTSTHNV